MAFKPILGHVSLIICKVTPNYEFPEEDTLLKGNMSFLV
jgi:hypothetical protein